MMPEAARVEPSLAARVVARTALLYREGGDTAVDRPAHVRAGSALAFFRERLVVVQDDANFIAFIEPATKRAEALALPSDDGVRQFDDSRGNKHRKLDLEAVIAHEDLLLAFGSGTTPARERVVIVRDEPHVLTAHALYEAMRRATKFSGSELNVEGAVVTGSDILFFQRGNGRGEAVDATARVALAPLLAHLLGQADCPPLREIVSWQLGAIEGVRLTFTDGAALADGRVAFLACAEASPDATRDGPVSGVALGLLDDRMGTCALAPIEDERGGLLTDKAEGLAFAGDGRAFVVVDRDDPQAPSELLELELGAGFVR